MAGGGAARHERWGLRLALVLVALSLRVLIPPGFMPGVTSGGGFPLVICTGHGPAVALSLADGHGKSPARPGKGDAPCAFAGHVLGPAPQVARAPVDLAATYVPVVLLGSPDLAPGRGLAAPPPPSTGPPVRLL